VAWAASRIVAELRAARERRRGRARRALLELSPRLWTAAQRDRARTGLAAAGDERAPAVSRGIAALAPQAGGTFPFTTAQLQAAHAQWTADWLSGNGRTTRTTAEGRRRHGRLAAAGGSAAAR